MKFTEDPCKVIIPETPDFNSQWASWEIKEKKNEKMEWTKNVQTFQLNEAKTHKNTNNLL